MTGASYTISRVLHLILFKCSDISELTTTLFCALYVKQHPCLQLMSPGVWVMAESPPSANVGWSMSYRRFSPSAGYQLHKPPLSVGCALGETTSANCVSFRLICNPHSTGYPTGLVPTLHPHLCTTLDSSYIWDTMVNLVHLQLMYVNMCFMKPSLTVWN